MKDIVKKVKHKNQIIFFVNMMKRPFFLSFFLSFFRTLDNNLYILCNALNSSHHCIAWQREFLLDFFIL